MNVDRLTQLADVLCNVPVTKFNMSYWGRYEGKDAPKQLDITKCGTAACAFGWACSIPEFQAAGLKLISWGGRGEAMYYVVQLTTPCMTYTDYRAAAKFFDLTWDEAAWIFNPVAYRPEAADEEWETGSVTPAQVVERIESLLAGKRGA